MTAFVPPPWHALGCASVVALLPSLVLAGPAAEPVSEYRLFAYPNPADTAAHGVANVTSAARLATRAFEELALELWEPTADRAGLGFLTRSAELIWIHAPAAIFAVVLAHELLGHGARARELGFSPSYRIHPPPPYYVALDGPWAYTDHGERALPTTLDEELLLDLGGLEADELMLREVAFTGFRSDTLRQGDLLLYTVGRLHLLSMLPRDESDAYRFYGHAATRYQVDESVPRGKLEAAALLSLVDPLLIYGLYASAARFIGRGARTHPYPALGAAGGVRLSGGYRPLPVPWGVEHQLEAMVGGELGHVVARVRIGDGVEQGSFAASLAMRDVQVSEHVRIGTSVELWSQPPLLLAHNPAGHGAGSAGSAGSAGIGMLGPGLPMARAEVVGGAAEVVGEQRLERWLWGMAIGGKTEGLEPGKVIGDDVYASVFMGVSL